MKKQQGQLILLSALIATILLISNRGITSSEEVIRLNLDDISTIGTKIETDKKIHIESDGSLRISTIWPTTISLGEVSGLGIDNSKLVYKAKVKSEKLEGKAFLEMWCHVDGGQYFSRGMNSAVTGSMNWKTLSTPFLLQKGQKAEKITLYIVINGKGIIWVDDIQLIQVPL
jgi:hypothetical protein